MRICRDLGLGKRSIAVASKLADHFGGDADGDGVGRYVFRYKAKGPDNGLFPHRHPRRDNTVAPHLAVLFQGHLSPFSGSCRVATNNYQK